MDSPQICSICLNPFDEQGGDGRGTTTTRCNHTFCTECLEQWLQVRSTCPTCREQLREHPLPEEIEDDDDDSNDDFDDDDDLDINSSDDEYPDGELITLKPSVQQEEGAGEQEARTRWTLLHILNDEDIVAWYYVINPQYPDLPNNQHLLCWFDAAADHPILGTEGRKQYTVPELHRILGEIRERKRNQIKDIRNGTNLLSQGPQVNLDGILFKFIDIENLEREETIYVPFIE